MIEMLTELRRDRCLNCNEVIVQYKGDLTLTPWWSHKDTGQKPCRFAPLAEPVTGGSTPNPTEATGTSAQGGQS